MKKIILRLNNEEGLHARPANLFSKIAMKCQCEIKVFKNGDGANEYNPKSIISILSMGAAKGDELTIIANGVDEEDAILKISELVNSNFK